MAKTLSVYFSSDRVYLAMVSNDKNSLILEYIDSTENPVDLEDPESGKSRMGIEELSEKLIPFKNEKCRATITMPSDYVLISKFPGSKNLSIDEIRQLVNLEIRQAYPQYDGSRFAANVVPLEANLNGKFMMQAIIIPKDNFRIAKKVMNPLNKLISNIEISQLNAHNAFIYNYPEQEDGAVVLFGVQDMFIDVSLIVAKRPVYYHLLSYPDKSMIGAICNKELQLINNKYSKFINSVYFFGIGLTREVMDLVKEECSDVTRNIGKLNAFRMMATSLSDREVEYCTRVSHIFPPCIGGAMPPYHERIKVV